MTPVTHRPAHAPPGVLAWLNGLRHVRAFTSRAGCGCRSGGLPVTRRAFPCARARPSSFTGVACFRRSCRRHLRPGRAPYRADRFSEPGTRQRLPSRPSRISWSLGPGLRSRFPASSMIMSGVRIRTAHSVARCGTAFCSGATRRFARP